MNIYEDEQEEGGKVDVVAFLKRNKQLVWMAVAFVFAYGFMSMTSKSLDEAVARQEAASNAEHRSPWAKDQ